MLVILLAFTIFSTFEHKLENTLSFDPSVCLAIQTR